MIEKMKLFWGNNKRSLIFIMISISLLTLSYYYGNTIKNDKTIPTGKLILNDISVILAIPSFIMSFIVLNVVNITPRELDRHHKAMTLKDKDKEKSFESYSLFIEENFRKTEKVLEKVNIYIVRKNGNQQINKQLINQCSDDFDQITTFFKKTKKEIESEVISIISTKDGISIIDDVDYSSIDMTASELKELGILLNSLTSNLFTKEELVGTQLEMLTSLFDEDTGKFTKFWEINKTYMKMKKIDLLEEGAEEDGE